MNNYNDLPGAATRTQSALHLACSPSICADIHSGPRPGRGRRPARYHHLQPPAAAAPCRATDAPRQLARQRRQRVGHDQKEQPQPAIQSAKRAAAGAFPWQQLRATKSHLRYDVRAGSGFVTASYVALGGRSDFVARRGRSPPPARPPFNPEMTAGSFRSSSRHDNHPGKTAGGGPVRATRAALLSGL